MRTGRRGGNRTPGNSFCDDMGHVFITARSINSRELLALSRRACKCTDIVLNLLIPQWAVRRHMGERW
jgi:hypothetical protein